MRNSRFTDHQIVAIICAARVAPGRGRLLEFTPRALAEPGGAKLERSQLLQVDGLSNRGRYAEEEQREFYFFHWL